MKSGFLFSNYRTFISNSIVLFSKLYVPLQLLYIFYTWLLHPTPTVTAVFSISIIYTFSRP